MRSAGGCRGKRTAPADGDGWDWGAIYASIATATGYRFRDIDELSLDDIADLWMYWREHPPVHISVSAALRAWGGKPSSRSVTARSQANEGAGGTSAMEAVAAILGPPVHKFRPPCRMLQPVQASAQESA